MKDKRLYRDSPFLVSMALLLALGAAVAWAGEYNESDAVAIRGYDPVAYQTEQMPAPGKAAFTAVHKNSTFQFKSAANRDAFVAQPDKYAPQFGGFCAFGVSRGYKADISPQAFSVVDGKLYLNYSAEVKAKWSADIPGYIARARQQWPAVEKITRVFR